MQYYFYTITFIDIFVIKTHGSVTHMAKKVEHVTTTVSYLHDQLTLIERSCNKSSYLKITADYKSTFSSYFVI